DRQFLIFRQNFNAIKVSLCRDAIDLRKSFANLILNRSQIRRRIGAVSSLNSQFSNALQVVVDFVQRAFSRLGDGDTIVGVTASLRQTLDVCSETVSNGLTSSV